MPVDVFGCYEEQVPKPIDLSAAPSVPTSGHEVLALLLLQALYGTGILSAFALFATHSPFVALLMGAVGALLGPVVAEFARPLVRLAPALFTPRRAPVRSRSSD